MKNTFKSYIAMWAVLLVVFNVIAFVAPGWTGQEKYTESFWVGYIFIMIAFAGQLACAKLAFDAKNLQKLFYNIPLIKLSYTGLIVSFIAGGACMLISHLPYWIGVIVCVIVLAVTAIAVIKAKTAGDIVSDIDQKVKVQTFFIKSLTVDADSLMAKAQTDEIKNECKKVYEAVRYSDSMSNDALAAVESQITHKFADLSEAVQANNLETVQAVAKEVVILVNDRNKKCMLLK